MIPGPGDFCFGWAAGFASLSKFIRVSSIPAPVLRAITRNTSGRRGIKYDPNQGVDASARFFHNRCAEPAWLMV